MARPLSRRAVTTYVAEQLLEGNRQVIAQLAAYLISTRRTRSLQLFVRDIETVFADRGQVLADVISAHDLTAETERQIVAYVKSQTKAKSVIVRAQREPSALGGLRLRIPGRELDATIGRQLTVLRTQFKKA